MNRKTVLVLAGGFAVVLGLWAFTMWFCLGDKQGAVPAAEPAPKCKGCDKNGCCQEFEGKHECGCAGCECPDGKGCKCDPLECMGKDGCKAECPGQKVKAVCGCIYCACGQGEECSCTEEKCKQSGCKCGRPGK